MTALILGLILFLGAHSVRIVADDWRSAQIARRGPGAWKGLYTLVSLLGFGLIVWGYGQARQQPVALWTPQLWARHLAALLMLFSFILLVAAYVPKNGIKSAVHHPMVLSVKVSTPAPAAMGPYELAARPIAQAGANQTQVQQLLARVGFK